MPLSVKDYTWEETDSSLWINIPLKGVNAKKVDVFSTNEYLKVNYPPYFFECLLFAPVEKYQGSAVIDDSGIILKLTKKTPVYWNKLHSADSDNKEVMKRKRDEALLEFQQQMEDVAIEKSNMKREHGKTAINEMLKIEQLERERILQIKENERKNATEALEKWKEEQRRIAEKEKEKLYQENNIKPKPKLRHKVKSNSLFEKDNSESVRETGSIIVKHTPRVFPTPTRESQAQQEEEWLKKQAEARKGIQMSLDNELSDKEKNPQWLLDKGNSYYSSGDFQSAINAYTLAIHLAPNLPILYSNRGACHLKQNNLFKCIEDCSKALDLLFPPVQQNAASRAKALIRRGTAFCMLQMYIEGLKDYEAVLVIEPNNQAVLSDAQRIRNVVWVNPKETVISLQDRRLLNDDRLSIERSFLRDWNLHIRNVSLLDEGLYKCQINTAPIGTKKVHLIVQEPPQLIDYTQPTDVEKAEGGEVRLFCNATGSPQPTIKWYRIFKKRNLHREHISNEGEFLYIKNLTKHCADYYECVAENDVNPSTSQTFKVTVLYPPIVTLYNDRLSQHLGKDTALECYVTASPQGTAGWKHAGKPIVNDPNHEVVNMYYTIIRPIVNDPNHEVVKMYYTIIRPIVNDPNHEVVNMYYTIIRPIVNDPNHEVVNMYYTFIRPIVNDPNHEVVNMYYTFIRPILNDPNHEVVNMYYTFIRPIVNDPNHEVVVYESQSEADTVILSVRILRIEPQDYGAYSCEATNSLGTGSGTMMLYELSTTTLPTSTTSTTVTSHRVINSKHQKHHGQDNLQSPHDKTLHENQLPSRPQGGSSSQAVAFSDGTKFQGSEGVIVPGASKNGTNCGLCTWWLTLLYIVHTVHMMFS
ncbi:Dynein assembly factor 4, axonemal [Bulinus truncatus]|nr:Dynein assembly factor 4, axonemal [Bulinus truncatus]